MHRLKDFWNHKANEALDRGMSIEPYEEWLARIGVSEEKDDEGEYGDDEPVWALTPPKVLPIHTYRVWTDNKSFETFIKAESMKDALDEAARQLGATDYADLAQREGWGEGDGLNIEVVSEGYM